MGAELVRVAVEVEDDRPVEQTGCSRLVVNGPNRLSAIGRFVGDLGDRALDAVMATYDQPGSEVIAVFAARMLLEESARLMWRYSAKPEEFEARAISTSTNTGPEQRGQWA